MAGSIAKAVMEKVAAEAIGDVGVEIYKDVKSMGAEFLANQRNMDDNYKFMDGKAKKLYAMRDDVLAKINRNKENESTKECQVWIDQVNKLQEEVKDLESKYFMETEGILQRAGISKLLKEKGDEINSCCEEGSKIQVLVARPPKPVIEMKAPKIEDKPTLYEVFKKMTSYLEDKNIKKIGLWGMAGVGKTAILKNLNNSELIAKMFDIVIFATLTDEVNKGKLKDANEELRREALQLAKEKLRREIAQRLKLNMEGMSNSEITSEISEQLKGKKYLFLLDNIWGEFDLDDIGIYDNHRNNKVILASRHRDLCKFMDVDENVKVERLSETEAITLFREKLGKSSNHTNFEEAAKLVVRHCSNLPLLIDKVAGFFKKKEKSFWRSLVKKFQIWPYVEFSAVDEVLKLLRFCFEELDGEDKKRCFLYSALYTDSCDIYTNYLVECCTAEGIVADMDSGHIIVGDLIDASLLEEGEKKKCVRMNKVLRNMALKISLERKDLKFLVRAAEELKEPPIDEEWKEANWISLMDNRLNSLPRKPDCINLSTLLLQRNDALTVIPELFFKSMQNLRVLDLHGTKIATLPSLSSLIRLKALYLNSCDQLKELPSDIKALENLEVLDIQGSGICYLPSQIGYLSNLRCLRVSFSKFDGQSGNMEKHKVISGLSSLEELAIEVEAHNQWWEDVVKDMTEEVAMLRKLTSLSFCFPDVSCLEIFINKSSFLKEPAFTFLFSVNNHCSKRFKILDYFEKDFSGCLKYADGEGADQAISKLLAKTNAFELIGHKGSLKLSDFGVESLNKLQGCLIEGCKEIKTIIDANGIREAVLPSLEKIYIRNVPKLGSIWEGPVPPGSLSQLTVLVVSKCSKLKNIFCHAMIRQLSELQYLEVKECHEIEEIVVEFENDGTEPCVFPSLKTMILQYLPKLRSIWKKNTVNCPSLDRWEMIKCPELLDFDCMT